MIDRSIARSLNHSIGRSIERWLQAEQNPRRRLRVTPLVCNCTDTKSSLCDRFVQGAWLCVRPSAARNAKPLDRSLTQSLDRSLNRARAASRAKPLAQVARDSAGMQLHWHEVFIVRPLRPRVWLCVRPSAAHSRGSSFRSHSHPTESDRCGLLPETSSTSPPLPV